MPAVARAVRHRPRFALLLCAVSVLAIRWAAAEDSAEPIVVRFSGAGSCNDASAFLGQVRARTSRVRVATDGRNARTFHVELHADPKGIRGHLSVTGPGGTSTDRVVVGRDCDEAISALGLIAALIIDPQAITSPRVASVAASAATSASAPPVASASASAAPAPAPSPLPIATTATPTGIDARPGWKIGAGARLGYASGLAPKAMWVGGLMVAVEHEGKAEVSLRAVVEHAFASQVEMGTASARFSWTAGAVEACFGAFRTSWGLRMLPCAMVEAGALSATGSGIENSASNTRPWVAAGLAGRIRWLPWRGIFIEATGGARFPLVRDRFYFEPDTTVFRAPAVSGEASLGAGVTFL